MKHFLTIFLLLVSVCVCGKELTVKKGAVDFDVITEFLETYHPNTTDGYLYTSIVYAAYGKNIIPNKNGGIQGLLGNTYYDRVFKQNLCFVHISIGFGKRSVPYYLVSLNDHARGSCKIAVKILEAALEIVNEYWKETGGKPDSDTLWELRPDKIKKRLAFYKRQTEVLDFLYCL